MHWSSDVLHHVFAFERTMPTPYTLATVFAPVIFTYYVMAVLVQFPHTHLYRAALLPIVLWLAFRSNMSLDFSWNYPGWDFFNQGLALWMFTIAMRCTVWALAQTNYYRLPIIKSVNGDINGHNGKTPVERAVSVPTAMWDAWDLVANLRGIGWVGPQKMYIPEPYFRVESRFLFFFMSLGRVIFLVVASDFAARYIRAFGPDTFGTPRGGTIFDASLPPLERYTRSSIITFVAGFSAYAIIAAVYHLQAALFTLLFQQYPSQWPPLFDSPWLSTSLASFWGRRWHQVFREPFVMLGSKPMERYFGRIGALMGAFAVSGVLHDVGTRAMGRGSYMLPVVGFFLLHGVFIALEYAWKKATGKRVGGVFGLLWVYFVFILSGHIFVESWGKTGLLAAKCYPDAYSPSTLFLNWIGTR